MKVKKKIKNIKTYKICHELGQLNLQIMHTGSCSAVFFSFFFYNSAGCWTVSLEKHADPCHCLYFSNHLNIVGFFCFFFPVVAVICVL